MFLPASLLFVTGSFAGELSLTASAVAETEYDDNRTFSVAQTTETWGAVVLPRVQFMRRTSISSLRSSAWMRYAKYNDDTIKQSDIYYANLLYNLQGLRSKFKFSGLVKKDSTIEFVRNSDVSDETEADELGISDTDVSDADEGLIEVEIDRLFYEFKPRFTYKLSKTFSSFVSYSYRTLEHDDNSNINLVDYERQQATLGLNYKLSKLHGFGFSLGTATVDPEIGSKIRNNNLSLRHSYKLLKSLSFSTSLGFRTTTRDGNENDGTTLNFGLRKTNISSVYRLSARRGISESASGEIVQRDELEARVNKKLTPLTAAVVNLRYFRNERLGSSGSATDRTYYLARIAINTRLNRYWGIGAGYRYRTQEYHESGDIAESNAVYLSIEYAKRNLM